MDPATVAAHRCSCPWPWLPSPADSVAGGANLGTLRYRLTVPVQRTRLLAVNYAAIVIFAPTATLLVAAVGILILNSEIMDATPQLSGLHPYLLIHYWLAFGDLLRDPIADQQILRGLMVAAIHGVLFWTATWARFAGKDVSR